MDWPEVGNRLAGRQQAVEQHIRSSEHFQCIQHRVPLPDTHNWHWPAELPSDQHNPPEVEGTERTRQTGELVERMQVPLVRCSLVEDNWLKIAVSRHPQVQKWVHMPGHKEVPAVLEHLCRMDMPAVPMRSMDIDLAEGLDTSDLRAVAPEIVRMWVGHHEEQHMQIFHRVQQIVVHTFQFESRWAVDHTSAEVVVGCHIWVHRNLARSSVEVEAARRVLDVRNHQELATDRSYS